MTIGSKGSIPAFSRPFEINELGYIADEETIRLCYGVADMFVFPSLADNLPLVLMESLACGTPMVAFDVGGVSDMVRHNETGYLARYRDSADLAHGITTLLENPDLSQTMSENCRAIAEKEYGIDLQVQRYLDLYQTVIDRQRSEQ